MPSSPQLFSSAFDCLSRVALAAGLLAVCLEPSSARADASALEGVIEARCTGVQVQSWSPGLRLQSQTGTYRNETHYTCDTAVPGLASASFSVTTSYTHGCSLDPSAGTVTLTWNDGQQSRYVFNGTSVDVGGNGQVYVSTGTVFSGRFFGDQVVVVNPSVDLNQLLACLSPPGLTRLEGSSVLLFLKTR